MGVLGIQKGDVVALISGNGYPVILRGNREGIEYKVVGTAYMEGTMNVRLGVAMERTLESWFWYDHEILPVISRQSSPPFACVLCAKQQRT